jgi:hypothetical protein
LGNNAGDIVGSTAFCQFGEQLLGCGFDLGGLAQQLLNTVPRVIPKIEALGFCDAYLFRTSDTDSEAGATITAYALCSTVPA